MCRGALGHGRIGANMIPWQIKVSDKKCRGANLKSLRKIRNGGVEEMEQTDIPRGAEMRDQVTPEN